MDRAPAPGAAGALLQRDATDRPCLRDTGGPAAAGSRGHGGISGADAGSGRAHSSDSDREGAGWLYPASVDGSTVCAARRSTPGRLRLDAVARGWAPAKPASRRVRDPVEPGAEDGRHMARGRLACLESPDPHRLPMGRPGCARGRAARTMSSAIAPPVRNEGRERAFLGAISANLPAVRLLRDEVDRESYRADETPYLQTGLPLAVALPTTTAQVAELVRLAAAHLVPLVPRGAGTGLSGGAAGVEGALTVAFTRMDRILEIDHENLCVVTQPGIINAELKKAVAAEGFFYAPDPASYEMCSIGGNLGTNAGGLCCVKYGQTRDAVLGLEVVLADGSVIRTGGKNIKDVAGYSLTHLMVGSQGTLGLITEATLRLRPAPPARSTMLAFFATLEPAGDAVSRITAAGLGPVTLELMDQFTIAAVDDWQGLGLDREAAGMLLIESDLPAAAADAELAAAQEAC